jgi:hypothetical protein
MQARGRMSNGAQADFVYINHLTNDLLAVDSKHTLARHGAMLKGLCDEQTSVILST